MREDSLTFRQMSFDRIEYDSTDNDRVFEQTLYEFSSIYTANIVEDHYNRNSSKVSWHCFECKKKILVDVHSLMTDQEFDTKRLFCKTHEPPTYFKAYKRNTIFQRYLVSFHNYLKQTIVRNSKSGDLLQWKDLQQSESTSQLIQPESRSLYRNQRRKKKKLYTFKFVLGK